jgi:hypothetical protein
MNNTAGSKTIEPRELKGFSRNIISQYSNGCNHGKIIRDPSRKPETINALNQVTIRAVSKLPLTRRMPATTAKMFRLDE